MCSMSGNSPGRRALLQDNCCNDHRAHLTSVCHLVKITWQVSGFFLSLPLFLYIFPPFNSFFLPFRTKVKFSCLKCSVVKCLFQFAILKDERFYSIYLTVCQYMFALLSVCLFAGLSIYLSMTPLIVLYGEP